MGIRRYALLLSLLCFLSIQAQADDAKRETEVSDAIALTLNFGKIEWLQAGSTKFLSLYAETEKTTSKGVVILLHDIDSHPDHQPVIYQLRRLLPEHQWATLSLQMPLREMDAGVEEYFALFPDALARIQAGIKFAKDSGAKNIVLVGYGLGALQAVYAQSQQPLEIKALVGISLPVPASTNSTVQTLAMLKTIKLPILDVYGSLDVPEVVQTARDRRLATKENSAYRQLVIDDEGHQFLHDEGLLGKRIVSWLAKVVGG